MENRLSKTVLICDNDADHSFTIEGELRNRNFEVIVVNDASELVSNIKSLRPVALVVNPDMKGFNEHAVCKEVMTAMNIPVILLIERNSTRRAQVGDCSADDVMIKPVVVENLANLIHKQMALHKSHP